MIIEVCIAIQWPIPLLAPDNFAFIQAEMVSLPDVEQHPGQVFILHFSLDSVKNEDPPLLFFCRGNYP